MRGIDTNILIRFLTRDDEEQAKRAAQIISEECTEENPGFLTNIVLIELVWTLSRIFQYSPPQIVIALKALLNARELSFESPDEVKAAVHYYGEGKAGFADYLLGAVARTHGCSDTMTFDKKAAKLDLFSLA